MSGSKTDDLNNLRAQINSLDDQLLELLNKRMDVVREVGKLKKLNGAVIYRPEREKHILDRLKQANKGLLTEHAIEAIFLEIFAVSRNLELPEKVAYLGPIGSFSHQAAESRFGAMSEYLPLGTIPAVFEAVATDRVRFGIVPIENNQEGSVPDTVDCLAEYDIHIVAEVPLDIHFAFASLSSDLLNIKRIYSKDIAFAQCRKFIYEYFRDDTYEMIPVNSTSKAAIMAAEDPESAAICSHIAAQEHRLPIMFDNVENSSQNQTRFLIISKAFINQQSGADKTSILAKIPDTEKPGSLANFLQDFYQRKINLTKIESRPTKGVREFSYWFLIDFEGHYQDEKVQEVLARHDHYIKWLGSYVKLC